MGCPIWQANSNPKYRPFCSRRCADIDLGRWLNGSYAIAAEPDETTDLRPDDQPELPTRPH